MTRICKVIAVMLGTLLYIEGAVALNLRCSIGATVCVATQGTRIPSSQVLEIMSNCDDFTRNDLGRRALRMSLKEIHDSANGRLTPLVLASEAFGYLYDSPLMFDRKGNAEETDYWQIKRSCRQISIDFNDDGKWIK